MSTQLAQIQRTDFFFGGVERRAELLAEPACDCGDCDCPECTKFACSCSCPACTPGDDASKVEQDLLKSGSLGTSVAAAAAASLASKIAMGTLKTGSSTYHTGYFAGAWAWGV
jgi:hypothetical protein